ncbi:unnamed protein product [Orchesella dallaii]|uniref:Uncharacterized protein n=1 Tax=Orchesella dallaii TaxID=48710 RepID=A0ABP1R3Y9_9HEXA
MSLNLLVNPVVLDGSWIIILVVKYVFGGQTRQLLLVGRKTYSDWVNTTLMREKYGMTEAQFQIMNNGDAKEDDDAASDSSWVTETEEELNESIAGPECCAHRYHTIGKLIDKIQSMKHASENS